MKFKLSKFYLLCFLSNTFSRSLYVSSGKIDIDRETDGKGKYKDKSCLFKLSGS